MLIKMGSLSWLVVSFNNFLITIFRLKVLSRVSDLVLTKFTFILTW